ncbi:MAG: coproporphyrinogen dehydrogenase HemZ, partial [Epulopiscium sp.]|nr:coproporphyrinogen dehydrogenase HemZ [Candidatus Epulonipiscium sp.]
MTIKYGTIKLNVIGHNSEFELENIINAFRPYMNLQKTDYVVESKVEGTRVSSILLADTSVVESYTIEVESQDLTRQALKKSLYKVLSNFIGKDIPWGVLTGIRPTKIVHNYKKKGLTESTIKTKLIEEYCISREKADLMIDVARKEEEVLYQNKEGEISIYIGIPFCPTRCLYCSFTSYSLKEKGQLVDAYLDALVREMRYVSSRIKANTIRSIYIGGGTPTSLNDRQLEKLLKEVDKCFNIGEIEEYTIEAGRPDTLNRNKLRLMKKHNVDRISINPQTMRQETLKTIGRSHSVEDIKNVFNMAREEG